VLGHRAVDQVQHRRERRRLAATRGPRHKDDAALLASQLGNDRRQVQILQLRLPKRHETQNDRDQTPLPKGVDPETAHPRDRVGEVHLSLLSELLREDLL